MTFTARYRGRCVDCGEAIHEGDTIAMSEDGPLCQLCHDTDPGYRPWYRTRRDDNPVVCDTCWLTKPCDCED